MKNLYQEWSDNEFEAIAEATLVSLFSLNQLCPRRGSVIQYNSQFSPPNKKYITWLSNITMMMLTCCATRN